MIAQRQATKAAAAGNRTAFKTPVMRHSVRVRVSTEEAETAAPPKVDFMPNTQAVSTHQQQQHTFTVAVLPGIASP
jgi:hypothetical protein